MNTRHSSRAMSALLVLGLSISGCAIVPRFGPAPEVGPPSELAGSGPAETDSASTRTDARPTVARKREKPATPREGTANAAKPPAQGAVAPPVTPIATPSDSSKDSLDVAKGTIEGRPSASDSTPPRTLSIDLPEEERARLETQALQDIEAAQQLAAEAKVRSLSAAEEEKLLTVLGLIDQAEVARQGNDLSAASNLARKARLLAAELIPK